MSPRRRLRTRYEPGARPAPPRPPAARAPVAESADLAPAIETPAPPPAAVPAAMPAPPPVAEPEIAPPAAAEAAPVDPLLTPGAPERASERATEATVAAAPAAPASPPPAAGPAPAMTYVRPSPEVIEEWARAFEQPVPAPGTPEPEPGTPEPKPEVKRRPGNRIRAILTLGALALLAFVTGLFLFNNFVMPRLIHGVGQVTVPDLTNLTVEQAEQALRPLGLQTSRAGERFDPAAPRGFIIDQDPVAGTTVRGRKRVSIVVSLGEEYSSVPELFGESVRAARMLLERAGLQPGSVVQAPSDEAGEGLVAGSDPGAEAVLQRNTPVHILVSTGPGPESYVMPDLLGREIGSVRRTLEAIGFRVERSGARTPVGTIVAQMPAPGARITRANVIQLTASGRFIR